MNLPSKPKHGLGHIHIFINKVEYKWCPYHRAWEPITGFSKDNSHKDRLRRICRAAVKALRARPKSKENRRAYIREYMRRRYATDLLFREKRLKSGLAYKNKRRPA
jgi:hypothetical protein